MGKPDLEELRVRYGDEQVMVIPAAETASLPAGICPATPLPALLKNSIYLPRWRAEYNPKWRQLVSYIVLRQHDQVFLTQRLPSQGETRLHSLCAIGVGGHINVDDDADPVSRGWIRELEEELLLDWSIEQQSPIALINDLSNAVSRDHLGLLYLVNVPPENRILIREIDKMRGELLSLETVSSQWYHSLESWSQLVLDYLQKTHL